jgi:hypothetical protein
VPFNHAVARREVIVCAAPGSSTAGHGYSLSLVIVADEMSSVTIVHIETIEVRFGPKIKAN